MKIQTKFSISDILWARKYWADLTYKDLIEFWKHYTTGTGKGMYSQVNETTSFFDYLVLSASQSWYEKVNDL